MKSWFERARPWLWRLGAVLVLAQLVLAIVELRNHEAAARVWFAFIEVGVIALITVSLYLNRGTSPPDA